MAIKYQSTLLSYYYVTIHKTRDANMGARDEGHATFFLKKQNLELPKLIRNGFVLVLNKIFGGFNLSNEAC